MSESGSTSLWPQDLQLDPSAGRKERFRDVVFPKRIDVAQPRLGGGVEPPADLQQDRVGICCSGGGLRSASFSFGGLSVLWDNGILEDADYLAGVSGGSYAVTAATMVRKTSPTVDWEAEGTPAPFALDSPELDYLRNRTNYLAPGTAGRWNMFVRLVLGILVNATVVFSLVVMIGLVAGRAYHFWNPKLSITEPWWPVLLVALPGGLGVFLALLDLIFRPADDRTWRRLVRWSGALFIGAIVAAFFVYFVPVAVSLLFPRNSGEVKNPVDTFGSGATSGVVALLAAGAHVLFRNGSTLEGGTSRLQKYARRLLAILQKVVVSILGPAGLMAGFLAAVSWSLDRPADSTSSSKGGTPDAAHWTAAATVGFFLAAVAIGLFFLLANPIAWSAQPFYKRRLRTVFCVRRLRINGQTVAGPIPYSEEPKLSEMQPMGRWPKLLICAAANISDQGLTPPGLAVAGFVFSADRIGGPVTGSIDTAMYQSEITAVRPFQKAFHTLSNRVARRFGWPQRPLLGAIRDVSPLSAVSISGAAVSPSMGKMTKPAYRFLITLFNLRMGVWLPNPRLATHWNKKWLVRPWYLLREMRGANKLHHKFLYISDGGHYDNLGLIELLRRGCTTIYCLDASGDKPGENRTLGQAFALARSELGVEFDTVDTIGMSLSSEAGRLPATVGKTFDEITFRYAGSARICTLIYMRKSLDARASLDLLSYQAARPVFPYDGTGDQFYDVEQFEAYRQLGVHVASAAIAGTGRTGTRMARAAEAASATESAI